METILKRVSLPCKNERKSAKEKLKYVYRNNFTAHLSSICAQMALKSFAFIWNLMHISSFLCRYLSILNVFCDKNMRRYLTNERFFSIWWIQQASAYKPSLSLQRITITFCDMKALFDYKKFRTSVVINPSFYVLLHFKFDL